MDDHYWMRLALEEARIALSEGNWPIGCVIVLDGKEMVRAHNQVYSLNDKLAHAEMLALQQAKPVLMGRFHEAVLYTTCEPCPMCFGAAILMRVKRVVCGIDLDNSGAMYFREHLPLLFKQDKFSIQLITGVLQEECKHVFLQGEPTKKLVSAGILKI